MQEAAYRRYMLVVLAILLAFNSAERSALGVVLQDLKVDLSLSDTQLGFLTGMAFALFYSVMGIPIARWADRSDRARIISITAALCGSAVALSGLSANYVQLLLIRVGVAVGEAGGMPSALSLIADYFSRAERPRAMSIYLQGGALSLLIGYFAAGWIDQFYGWRLTFVALGSPCLAVAVVAGLTLKEPRRTDTLTRASAGELPTPRLVWRGSPAATISTPSGQPTLGAVFSTLWGKRTFRELLTFISLMSLFNFGIAQWLPAFLMRSYRLRTGELGTWTAAIGGLGLILGTYLGGAWASRRAAGNERLQLRVMAASIGIVGVLAFLMLFAPNRYWAFGFMGLWNAVGTAICGPMYALIQTLAPERMRATATTLVLLCTNLIGAGLGPLVAGGLSDLLRLWAGQESLRYALLALCPGYVWAAVHLWRAGATVNFDLRVVESESSLADRHQKGLVSASLDASVD
jgi:MFS transporter, Spinster family, sphingosine-1-phosphate transporter